MTARELNSILNVYPGDSLDIIFPDNFILDYVKTVMDENGDFIQCVFSTECVRMHTYYWDEDDHKCIDYYFYNNNDGNWFAKYYGLTDESRQKVYEYIKTNYKNFYN